MQKIVKNSFLKSICYFESIIRDDYITAVLGPYANKNPATGFPSDSSLFTRSELKRD